MINDYDLVTFGDNGYILVELNEEDLLPIKRDILELQYNFDEGTKIKKDLAGNIQREYALSLESMKRVNKIVFPYIDEYNKHFTHINDLEVLDRNVPFALDNPCWVNFQKKHEFNPLHKHTGVYSFVIWIQIPYLIEDEMDSPSVVDSNTKRRGCFEFAYTGTMGQIKTHPIMADKTMENYMILFPSTMLHSVYPFYTSDDYRISIAGNYLLSTKYLQ